MNLFDDLDDDLDDEPMEENWRLHMAWHDELQGIIHEYGTFSDEAEDYIQARCWDDNWLIEARIGQVIRRALKKRAETSEDGPCEADWPDEWFESPGA